MVHGHPVVDTDKHFLIDPTTRAITNAELTKNMLMQNDHNSERFSFEIPKIVEGHDMALCDAVEIHYMNTNSSTREKSVGVYEVKDFQIAETDPSMMTFTWLISDNCTVHPGTLSFLVLFECTEDGESLYRWYSNINASITISAGMNNGEEIVVSYPDILAQWRDELFSRNYAYEAAVESGFEGTQEEWVDHILTWGQTTYIWAAKQNKLGWVTEDDIDAMFDGTYVGEEDETSEGYYPSIAVVEDNLIINMGGDL